MSFGDFARDKEPRIRLVPSAKQDFKFGIVQLKEAIEIFMQAGFGTMEWFQQADWRSEGRNGFGPASKSQRRHDDENKIHRRRQNARQGNDEDSLEHHFV